MNSRGVSRFSRRRVVLAFALLAVLIVPGVVLAGGVAVEVDKPLPDPEAGQAFTIGFVVRSAHDDRALIDDLSPLVILTNPATDETVTETARREGERGHYVAQVTLPSAAEWRWEIWPFGKQDVDIAATQSPLKVRAPGEAPAANSPAPAGPTVDVAMLDSIFEPRDLTIEAGTTVTWTNKGKLPHTATDAQGRFASGNMDAGKTFAYTFTEPGTYQYYCEYHAPRPQGNRGLGRLLSPAAGPARGGGGHMVGMITVTAAAQDAQTDLSQSAGAAPAQPDNKLATIAQGEAVAKPAGSAEQALPATGGSRSSVLALGLVATVAAVGAGLALRGHSARARR